MKVKSWHAFAALSIIFLAVQATHFRYSVSDENTYFYMSKLLIEGNMPYRDFFYAHPPIHLIYLSIFQTIFGFNIMVMKATSAIPVIIAAAFMFSIAREKLGNIEAILATAIFYFSYDVMRYSTFATWLTLSVMFLVSGTYFAMKKKHLTSGMLMAIASLTGIFSIIGFAAAGAYLLLTDKKGFLRYSLAFISLFAVASIAITIFLGTDYLRDVYQYHLLKPSEGAGKADIFLHFIRSNPLIIAVIGLFLVSRQKSFLLPASIAGFYIITLFLMNKIFGYYFLAAAPFLILAGGYGIKDFIDRIETSRKQQATIILISAIAISSAASAYSYIGNDFQDFNEAENISKWVTENSNETDTIFGDDSITPLIGLLSGRKLAFNMADTNSLIWRSGMEDINETIKKIKEEKVKYVIERRLNQGRGSFIYGPWYVDQFKEFVNKECREVKSFKTPWRGYTKEHYVYECS